MTNTALTTASTEKETPSPEAYFKEVLRAFDGATEAAGGAIDRFVNVGGYVIRLRFAGDGLVPGITRAFEHLASTPIAQPALTICLWDSISTRTDMPCHPWLTDKHAADGEIWGYMGERTHAVFQPGIRLASILDRTRNLAVYWIRDALRLPFYERAKPLRHILHLWMQHHGRQFAHAGAIGTEKGGVLLAGRGGTGKSTVVISCLSSGLDYVSEDYCLLSTDPVPYAHSIYSSAMLDHEGLRWLPHLAHLVDGDTLDSEKSVLYLYSRYRESIVSGFPVRAILLPQITDHRKPALKKASPMSALRALGLSTVLQLPGAHQPAFHRMARFVQLVPAYVLELGADRVSVPELIADFLSED